MPSCHLFDACAFLDRIQRTIYSCTVLDRGTRLKLTAKISDEVQIHALIGDNTIVRADRAPADLRSGKFRQKAVLRFRTASPAMSVMQVAVALRKLVEPPAWRLWDSIQLQSIMLPSIVSLLDVSSQRLRFMLGWISGFFFYVTLFSCSHVSGVCLWYTPLVSCSHLFGVSSLEGCKQLIYWVMTSSFQTASPLSVPVRFCTELVSSGKDLAIKRPTGFQAATSGSRRACLDVPMAQMIDGSPVHRFSPT